MNVWKLNWSTQIIEERWKCLFGLTEKVQRKAKLHALVINSTKNSQHNTEGSGGDKDNQVRTVARDSFLRLLLGSRFCYSSHACEQQTTSLSLSHRRAV